MIRALTFTFTFTYSYIPKILNYSTAKYLSTNPLNPNLTFPAQRQISQLNPTSYHRDLSRTMSAVDEVGGPDDESFEEMAERLNVLPLPERQVSQPLSPRESEALEDEFEVLGAQMTGNPTFSAEGGQPNP